MTYTPFSPSQGLNLLHSTCCTLRIVRSALRLTLLHVPVCSAMINPMCAG